MKKTLLWIGALVVGAILGLLGLAQRVDGFRGDGLYATVPVVGSAYDRVGSDNHFRHLRLERVG